MYQYNALLIVLILILLVLYTLHTTEGIPHSVKIKGTILSLITIIIISFISLMDAVGITNIVNTYDGGDPKLQTLYSESEKEMIRKIAYVERDPPETYNDITGQIEYQAGRNMTATSYLQMHFGQRKLLLALVDFLTRQGYLSNNLVYAGAAPSYYMPFIVELFPKHTLWLIDPNKFGFHPPKQVHTYNEFFTDETAEKYKKQFKGDMLFMSDIRLTIEGAEEFEEGVDADNARHKRWLEIMRPKSASLKFRTPWHLKSPEYPYLAGEVRLQAWAPHSSTETRLEVVRSDSSTEPKEDYPTTIYNSTEYEQKFVYHNMVNRDWGYFRLSGVETPEVSGLDHCYDCARESAIWTKYLEVFPMSNETVASLMNKATKITSQRLDRPPHGLCPDTPMALKREQVLPNGKKNIMRQRKLDINPFWNSNEVANYPKCVKK